ncbi:MAG TPA: hypothetical protein DEB39_16950 [Planctomycetaceae bacterium]|nr:hypothetical protein [Planctomycetaceae bacterium]
MSDPFPPSTAETREPVVSHPGSEAPCSEGRFRKLLKHLPAFFRARSIGAANNALNPVLVREMRQIVRNNLLLALLCIYVFLMFVATFYVVRVNPSATPETGREAFQLLMGTLYIASTLGVVLFCAGNAVQDSLTDDMMFYSGLTMGQIVRGKLIAAALLTLLFHAATLPFLTLAYLLRGVDPGSVLFLLASAFLATQCINAVAFSFVIGVKSLAETLVSTVMFFVISPPLLATFGVIGGLGELTMFASVGIFIASVFLSLFLMTASLSISIYNLTSRKELNMATRIYFTLVTYLLLSVVLCGCLGGTVPFFLS